MKREGNERLPSSHQAAATGEEALWVLQLARGAGQPTPH